MCVINLSEMSILNNMFQLFSKSLKAKEVKMQNAKDENITENTFTGTSTKEYK